MGEPTPVDLIAEALHDHGPLTEATDAQPNPVRRWQDCPRALVHHGVAKRVATRLYDAGLLRVAPAGDDGTTTTQEQP